MDTGEFLRFRRAGAIRDDDGTRTVVDAPRRHDLLNRVVADGHVAAQLHLDGFLRIPASTRLHVSDATPPVDISPRTGNEFPVSLC